VGYALPFGDLLFDELGLILVRVSFGVPWFFVLVGVILVDLLLSQVTSLLDLEMWFGCSLTKARAPESSSFRLRYRWLKFLLALASGSLIYR
jgi:hypothetical protein